MATAKAIIAKLDRTLAKYNLVIRLVYKRVTTRSGGDDLIGRPATVTFTDILLTPQPTYERLARNIVGSYVPSTKTLASDGTLNSIGTEYSILLSPSHMTEAELNDPDISLVFKDDSGLVEVFALTDYEPLPFKGENLMTIAYIKSISRSDGAEQ